MLTSVSFSISQPWWPLCKISITIHTLQGCYVQKKLLTVIVHYRLGCSEYLSLWSSHWKVSFLFYEGWRGEGMYQDHTGDLCFPQRWRFIASERLLLHFDHLYLLPQCLHLEAVGAIRERGGRDYCLIPEIIGVVGRNDKTDGWAGWKPIIKAVGVPRRLGVPGPIGLGVESFIGT